MTENYKERLRRPTPVRTWIEVESSNLREVYYEPGVRQLTVRFHDRAVDGTGEYIYVGIPMFRFRNLIRAKSVGRYFNQHVKASKTYKEIQGY